MGFIQQTASSIANAYTLSVSTWFYAKLSEVISYGGSYLCEFGEDTVSHANSWLWVNSFGGFDNIQCGFTAPDVYVRNKEDNSEADFGVARLFFNSINQPPGSYFDRWMHLFVSIDTQNYATYTRPFNGDLVHMPKINLWVNGASKLELAGPQDPPIIFAVGTTHQAWINMNAFVAGNEVFAYAVPWQFNPNGQPFGQPLANPHATDFDPNPKIRFAETQMWFGQYIDPALHISKFIDTRGKPVDPSIPRAAFGPPSILFSRNSAQGKRYETNQGTGGSFTKGGTVSDFKPSPF